MNCSKCKNKIGFLSNYSSFDNPLCFDCDSIERDKKEKEIKEDKLRTKIEEELCNAKQKNKKENLSVITTVNSNKDEFVDYSEKSVTCQNCNSKLADSDENYGSEIQPLCKDCIQLAKGKNILKYSTITIFLLISYCLGIGSILLWMYRKKGWDGLADIFSGVGMGVIGGIIALILLFKSNGKNLRAFSVLSLIINSLIPLFIIIGLLILSKSD